jgi:hypothetical protein
MVKWFDGLMVQPPARGNPSGMGGAWWSAELEAAPLEHQINNKIIILLFRRIVLVGG